MKIEKRGTKYRIQPMIDGQRYSIEFDHNPTQKEIRSAIAECKHDFSEFEFTFGEACEKYIAMKKNVLSPTTIRSYAGILKKLSEEFKALPLKKVTKVHVQTIINKLAVDSSPKTCKNYLGFIMAVLKAFDDSIHFRITLPRKEKEDDYIPSQKEVRAVLEASKGTKWYICFMLGCYGLRRSEILPLTMFDIHDNYVDINKVKVKGIDKGYIVKNIGKTDSSLRRVPIPAELVDLIRQQGFVCDFHPDKILAHLHKYQDIAGVPRFRFHSLRHYFCTELSQANFSEEDIMALGGWSTPHVMKKVYRHQRINEDSKEQKRAVDTILNTLSV